MPASDDKHALIISPNQTPVEKRMHPVVARFRSGLREQDQRVLDELYGEAEENIKSVLRSVDFVTDLEKILFALLLQLLKRIYLKEEENKKGGF
jgi:hypothetical protein